MKPQDTNRDEKGFSYIDVMCALIILMIGILGLVAAITQSLMRSYETEQRLIAKQIAQSTVESIFAARDVRKVDGLAGWDRIGNAGSAQVPAGVFLNGWQPVGKNSGPDGLLGTVDDSEPMPGYERKILIEDFLDPDRPPPNPSGRRRITVTVQYSARGNFQKEEISTIIYSIKLPPE